MTRINHLRSFANSVPCQALLVTYTKNMQPIFDYGSIIYDNCSDGDKQILEKAQSQPPKSYHDALKPRPLTTC